MGKKSDGNFKQQGKKIIFRFKNNDLVMKREPSKNKLGEVINLYQETNDGNRFIIIVGWLQDDGKGGSTKEKSIIRGLTNVDECKKQVIPYLENLLS